MATIHFILQGKGGVGKSMIAAMLCQALRHFGHEVAAYDTDPVNATLASFPEFNATRVDVMKDGNIDARKFDILLEGLINAPENSHVVVDNGASSFIALGSYLMENDFLAVLSEYGHTVFFHSIVTGGQMVGDTVQGLSRLASGFPSAPIVVWLNPYFGEIRVDGKPFEEFTVYRDYGAQFHAIIDLPEGNRTLIGRDLEELLAKRMSFNAGINSSSFGVMEKQRLKGYWSEMLSRINEARLAPAGRESGDE